MLNQELTKAGLRTLLWAQVSPTFHWYHNDRRSIATSGLLSTYRARLEERSDLLWCQDHGGSWPVQAFPSPRTEPSLARLSFHLLYVPF